MSYTFDDIAGYKIEKEELKRICDVLANRELYREKGAKLPKGIIFYGEAGTGKTLFAKVLADVCGLYTFKIDIGNLDSSAQICKEIRKTFDKAARRKEPSMIFLDELDKLLPNDEEHYHTDQSKMVLAQLLTLIDGMNSANNFIFVATCNEYSELPDTLVRPGRIDKKINIGRPTYGSRVEILKFYANKSSCTFEISMEELAQLCSGFSCSALETLVNECIIQSDQNNFVSKRLVTERILEVKQEDIPRKPCGIKATINACRNLGTFVVARSFNNGKYLLNLQYSNLGNNFFNKILAEYDSEYEDDDFYVEDDDYDDSENDEDFDIMAENREIEEYVAEHGEDCLRDEEEEECNLFCKQDLLNAICVLCGGYVAEEVVLGKTYDNLFGYFTNIQAILLNMSGQGMFGIDNIYSVWRNQKLPYSMDFMERLDAKLAMTLSNCYRIAEKIITKNKDLIEKMIPILIEKEYMDSSVCEPILEALGGIRV